MTMPGPAPWEKGFYGHYKEPVYSDIPNYTNQPGAVAGVVCNQCLAVVQRVNAEAHTDWHNQQRSMTVSTVKWCDAGDHAFKAGRPGSQSVMGTEIDDDGNAVSVAQDVCPECAVEARKRRVVQAIETVKPEACPVCDKTALVYSKHAGTYQCMECGFNSNDLPVTMTLNRKYGESARPYKSDDRPEAGGHECGTGLNGAHCSLCNVDYCTVCGHTHNT